jgi:hypothetical protein
VTELMFLSAGHFFITLEMVFWNIDKEVIHAKVTAYPKEYANMIENHATLTMLHSDWQVIECRLAKKNNRKLQGSQPFFCANGSTWEDQSRYKCTDFGIILVQKQLKT